MAFFTSSWHCARTFIVRSIMVQHASLILEMLQHLAIFWVCKIAFSLIQNGQIGASFNIQSATAFFDFCLGEKLLIYKHSCVNKVSYWNFFEVKDRTVFGAIPIWIMTLGQSIKGIIKGLETVPLSVFDKNYSIINIFRIMVECKWICLRSHENLVPGEIPLLKELS